MPFQDAGTVAHQPARNGGLTNLIARGQTVTRRELNEPVALIVEQNISVNEESPGLALEQPRKSCLNLAFMAHVEDNNLLSGNASCGLQLTCVDFRPRIGRIHHEGDHGDIGYHLAQQLEPLGGELVEKQSYACSVAFRPTDTGDDADLDWIAASEEDDGNGGSCRFGCMR